MKTKLLIAAALFSLALPVAAQQEVVAEAYEIALGDLRLPQSEAGTIAFKECDECDYQTKRVSELTRYVVNGRTVSLVDFSKAVARVVDRDGQPVTVLHNIKDNRVTEISVNL
jgi:hypothetical protein